MHRKFKITVDGHPYEVLVEEIVSEGGAPAGGSVSWPASVAAASAAVAAAPAHAPVSRAAAGAGDEVAPLAGTVQSIDVTVGQVVQAGEKIAVLEAMKMKTEVHAKGAGKVVSIAVNVGESVDTGAVLLTLA
ncbi:biotin/lipoyl-binding protein [Rhodoblastus acidophilus]|uniref:Biotin/lipoyl-binding protein n=1 Tax=Rhodoblastus acidophilus TaxID=1074 RepID=A0A6N8DPT1_RHOAC|nr:biotin/lipoyl-containing protein [Rhodoblastus acidophilus]MCW2275701.1 biotin carboxyl carrier protein [Rhodoblastus acidophilus]MTV31866.1 biotin/lipoyl-binding protein [Rhodoblastus acidophilus]